MFSSAYSESLLRIGEELNRECFPNVPELRVGDDIKFAFLSVRNGDGEKGG
jgi:hypothetical protein